MTSIDLAELPPEVAARLRAGAVLTDHGEAVATSVPVTALVGLHDQGTSLGELADHFGMPSADAAVILAANGRDAYRYTVADLEAESADLATWRSGR